MNYLDNASVNVYRCAWRGQKAAAQSLGDDEARGAVQEMPGMQARERDDAASHQTSDMGRLSRYCGEIDAHGQFTEKDGAP